MEKNNQFNTIKKIIKSKCKEAMIKKNHSSDFNLRKSYFAGRHNVCQELLEEIRRLTI